MSSKVSKSKLRAKGVELVAQYIKSIRNKDAGSLFFGQMVFIIFSAITMNFVARPTLITFTTFKKKSQAKKRPKYPPDVHCGDAQLYSGGYRIKIYLDVIKDYYDKDAEKHLFKTIIHECKHIVDQEYDQHYTESAADDAEKLSAQFLKIYNWCIRAYGIGL